MTLPALWPHQVAGLQRAREAMATCKRVVIQVPTGGGKTRLGVEVVLRGVARGRRWLWLAHRTELVTQARDTLVRAGLAPTVIAASVASAPLLSDSRVTVASIQTLTARDGIALPDVDGIVADECHHLGEGAETWSALLRRWPEAYVLGLTATPERGDGTGLAPMFERLIQVVSVRELTMAGQLVPCEVVRPARYLRERGATGNRLAKEPVDAWLEHCGQRQGFLFAASVEEATRYADELCARGVVARVVHGKTPADERAAVLEGFRAGRVKVVTNCYVMTEGVDLPMAEACVLARGCSTAGMYLQIVGRVLRAAPGKKEALLVDLPGVSHLHGMPEDERVWKLDGRACVVAGAKCRVCGKPLESYPCSSCGYQPDEGDAACTSTEITNDPLVKFARKIAEGTEQRWETLLRWLRAAEYKGWKLTSVRHKWKAVYSEELSPEWFAAACGALNAINPIDRPPSERSGV